MLPVVCQPSFDKLSDEPDWPLASFYGLQVTGQMNFDGLPGQLTGS
jgi:hypothetical protein